MTRGYRERRRLQKKAGEKIVRPVVATVLRRPNIASAVWKHPHPHVGRPAYGSYPLLKRSITRASASLPHPSQWDDLAKSGKHFRSFRLPINVGRVAAIVGTTTPGMDIPTIAFYRKLPAKSLVKLGMKQSLRFAGPIGVAVWAYTGYEAVQYLRNK